MKPRLIIVIFLIGVIMTSACGQASESLQGNALGAASPDAIAAATSAGLPQPTAVITPTMHVRPTVDIGMDIDPAQMIAAAIAYSEWREAIVNGQPQAVLAVPGTPESIRVLGLNIGNWDPTCARPMYLVILKGAFDGRNLFASPADERALPGQYVAYVFDLSAGVPGAVTFTILSGDGAAFKQALGDPALPDPNVTVPAPSPPYPPCDDVTLPGNPQPQAPAAP